MKAPDFSDAEFELLQKILAQEIDACIAAQDNAETVKVNELIQKLHDARRPATRQTRLLDSKP